MQDKVEISHKVKNEKQKVNEEKEVTVECKLEGKVEALYHMSRGGKVIKENRMGRTEEERRKRRAGSCLSRVPTGLRDFTSSASSAKFKVGLTCIWREKSTQLTLKLCMMAARGLTQRLGEQEIEIE